MKQYLQQRKGLVQGVFDKVFDKYDAMNDFMSLGAHRVWKKNFILSPDLFLFKLKIIGKKRAVIC